jgi:hypothetical protein
MSLEEESVKAMELIFNQFKRSSPVTFYKSPSEEVVVSDSSWNSDFEDAYSSNIIKTAQKREVVCRAWYLKEDELLKSLNISDKEDINLFAPIGRVRIQVKEEDFLWLKDAKSFYFLGNKFVKDSDWRGVGMLQTFAYFEIILKKNQ